MASSNKSQAISNMDVDYVIVYKVGDTDKPKAIAQFQKLLEALSSKGLATTVRPGADYSVLIFVKMASEEHLGSEAYKSRVKDWLHGVRTAAPDKETQSSLNKEPMHEAERLRIIYQAITNPEQEGGCGITPQHGKWENVDAIFALHDHEVNKKWMKSWASKYTLTVEDLDDIRNRLGEKVAFYFAFTQSYFTALIAISCFGFAAWFFLGYFSPVYAIGNSLLCVFFVEYWKRQEYDLAVRWGVSGVRNIETKRHNFRAEKQITDPITGEEVQFFPEPKRIRRQLLQIPFALAAACSLTLLIGTAFAIEIFVGEVYKGPGKAVLVYLPTLILTTMQPVLLGFLTDLAKSLTSYENYETDAAWDKAMVQKIFVLNFITSYLPIFLTAFVYVPFANVLVPYLDVFSLIVKPLAKNKKQMEAPPKNTFHINPSRLRKQVIYFTVTAQVVNQLLEVVVPYLKRRGLLKFKEIKNARAEARGGAAPDVSENDTPEEASFLKRVRAEAELENYDVTTDFREMVVQYGYLSMFSVVWPLTSVSFLVNNWIELRTDAIKICVETRRPTPWRADGIGAWLDTLGFLTWLGSITTAAITYMFSDGGRGPDGHPSEIRMWMLLLTVFFSEHIYLGVRWAVQNFMSKIDSPGRQKERKERFLVRKRYLEESFGEKSSQISRKPVPSHTPDLNRASLEEEARQQTLNTPEDRFWGRQRGWEESSKIGVGILESSKQESKKTK